MVTLLAKKQAEEAAYGVWNDQVTSALGELTLSKMAGEIDENTFNYYANAIVKQAADDADDKKEKKKSSETRIGKNISRAIGGVVGNHLAPFDVTSENKFLDKSHEFNKRFDSGDIMGAGEYADKVENRWKKQNPGKAKLRRARGLGAIGAGIAAGDVAYRLGHKALDAYKGRFKDNN